VYEGSLSSKSRGDVWISIGQDVSQSTITGGLNAFDSKYALGLALAGFLVMLVAPDSMATSQWSRKYGVSCNTCHSIFPRLNAYGERFLKNGYQDPDNSMPDGGTKGKKSLNDDLQLDQVENFLGVRLNLTPFRMQTKSLTVEGEPKSKFTFGETNWFQVFYAGSISKNLSIFIEAETEQGVALFNWYYLGLHHVYGDVVNFQLGNVSPLEFASFPNRLPQLPALKSPVFLLKSSGGASGANAAEDAVDMSSARHGIQYYGWTGPVTWWLGIGPGGNSAANVNDQTNLWFGGRYDVGDDMGSIAGSNATFWFYSGTDAANTAGAGGTKQHTNAFTRISPQVNLRMENVDVQAAYVMASDDNYTLVANDDAAKKKVSFSGMTVIGTYMMGKWVPGVQFDNISSTDNKTLERTYFTPVVTYLWKENVRYSLYAKMDLKSEVTAANATADKPAYTPKNDIQVNIRVMF